MLVGDRRSMPYASGGEKRNATLFLTSDLALFVYNSNLKGLRFTGEERSATSSDAWCSVKMAAHLGATVIAKIRLGDEL